jgi:CBS domain-containing protein
VHSHTTDLSTVPDGGAANVTTSNKDRPPRDEGAGPATPIGNLALRSPVHVEPGASLRQAASVVRREDISSVLVDTDPASFLTERDLTRAVAEGIDPSEPVTRVCTTAPIWVAPAITVVNAAAMMVGFELRHLLVIAAGGQPIGVLSMRDAFEILLRNAEASGWLAGFSAAMDDAVDG